MIPYLGVLGGWGWGTERATSPERLLGRPREMCNSLHPARVDALSEGAGTPKVPPEPAKGRREDPVPSTEENLARFEGAPWAFGARFSVPRTASTATFWSSRYQLGSHPFPRELAAKLCSDFCFPGVGGCGRRPSRMYTFRDQRFSLVWKGAS